MRLKLNTPLQVSDLPFAAAEEILASERKAAEAEMRAATGVGDAMEAYADAMSEDFGAQLDAVRQCVLRSVARCDDVLDSTLRLTNAAELFTAYVLGTAAAPRGAHETAVLGDARAELRAALAEHTGWLKRNNQNQLAAYESAVRARGFDPAETDLGLAAVIAAEGDEEGTPEKTRGDRTRVTNPGNERKPRRIWEMSSRRIPTRRVSDAPRTSYGAGTPRKTKPPRRRSRRGSTTRRRRRFSKRR